MYVNLHESNCLLLNDHQGWNIYQKCLKRYKLSTHHARGEELQTGSLSESEWRFVFERVGALGRKVENDKKQFSRDQQATASVVAAFEQFKAKNSYENMRSESLLQLVAQSVTPEAEFVLDLRYFVRSVRVTLNQCYNYCYF